MIKCLKVAIHAHLLSIKNVGLANIASLFLIPAIFIVIISAIGYIDPFPLYNCIYSIPVIIMFAIAVIKQVFLLNISKATAICLQCINISLLIC